MQPSERLAKPVSLFYAYSPKDDVWRERLEVHVSLLRHDGIVLGYDRRITAGTEWAGQIDQHIDSADIILLLVSADFIASDYCYDIELKRALERHDRGEARVIPVILRPVDWYATPFGRLQALPRNGKPITMWRNRDAALLDVTHGIREAAMQLKARIPGASIVVGPSVIATRSDIESHTKIDEISIFKFIKRLSPQDICMVIANLEGAAMHVSRQGTVAEQAAELIRWAESPSGPGLPAIKQILTDIFQFQ